ncbi:MAG: SRPBCC family protein [Candidatus Promineofilum sp.]|nr:SRPBCC family protein [Promineifilum sp.]
MSEYSFVDHWFIAAPIETVYRTIADPRTFPQWWRDYDQITILKDAPFPHVGGQAEFLVRSPFGYRLRIVVETVAADPPHSITTHSTGQLQGTGIWEFREEGGTTHVTFTWIVRSAHPLITRLEWVAKPLFALSHAIVSGRGHRGLKRLLEAAPATA